MASEIRVDKINSLSGVGTVTLSPTGVDIAGITTAATLRATTGIVTSLTAGSLTSLGAVSGTTGTFTGDVDIASSLVHTGDTDTKLQFTTDNISLQTGGTARVNITSSGNLEMPNDNDYIKLGAGGDLSLVHNGSTSYIQNATGFLEFQSNGHRFSLQDGTEKARIDTSGRLLIGLTGAVSLPYTTHGAIQTQGAYNTSSINIINNESSGNTSALTFNKIRGSGAAGGTDTMGGINWGAYDGSAWRSGATLEGKLTSIGSNAVPSKLIFKVNSGSSNTERFAITPNGVTFNGDTAAANALDDYEEGTFTPTAAEGGSVSSYVVQRGSYTKTGDYVICQIDLSVNGTASGDAFRVGGLPFTSANQATYAFGGAFLAYSNGAFPTGSNNRALFHVLSGSTVIGAYQEAGSPLAGNSTGMNVYGNKEFLLVVTYKAS